MGLDAVEVLLTIEEQYGIQIPDRSFPKVRTVQDLADMVCQLIQEQKGTNPDPQIVMQEVIEIIKEMSSKWRPAPITPETNLTDVLSM